MSMPVGFVFLGVEGTHDVLEFGPGLRGFRV